MLAIKSSLEVDFAENAIAKPLNPSLALLNASGVQKSRKSAICFTSFPSVINWAICFIAAAYALCRELYFASPKMTVFVLEFWLRKSKFREWNM